MRIPVLVQVSSGAFGHQILDYEQIMYNCQTLEKQVFPIFFESSKSANLYFLEQMKQRHFLLPHFPTVYIHKALCRLSRKYMSFSILLSKADTSKLGVIHKQSICTLASKIQSDHQAINKLPANFPINRTLVGVVIRDNGYDASRGINIKTDSNRHRNSSLDVFLPSIETIIDSGRTIIRFGRNNSYVKNISLSFWDLSNPAMGSFCESADFVLASRCEFFISTGSGPDCLGMFFRKPTYLVDTNFPVLPQTQVVKKFFLKHYFYTNHFGETIRLEFEELNRLFKFPDKVIEKLKTGQLFTRSRSSAQIQHFITYQILKENMHSESAEYSEVDSGVFY